MRVFLLVLLCLVLFATTQIQSRTIDALKEVDAEKPQVQLGKENKTGDVYIRVSKGTKIHYF